MKQPRHLLALSIAAIISVSAQAQSPQQLADDAADAYSYGDYEEASQLYQALNAQEPSYDTQYNLAVCYYKLGQYTQAEALFKALHDEDPDDDNVTLNLAFTEEKLNKDSSAQARYEWLANAAISDSIALVASKRIAAFNTEQRPQAVTKNTASSDDKMWMINATLSYGNDDNVISFVDETIVNDANEAQTVARAVTGAQNFTEFTFTPIWYSSDDFQNNWVIDSTIFKSDYADASDYNIDVISVGVRKNFGFDRANTVYTSLRMDRSTVGGEGYLSTTTLEVGNRYKPNKNIAIKYGARFQQGDALSDRFSAFGGDTIRLFIDGSRRFNKHRLKLRLQMDDENRGMRGNFDIAQDISHYSTIRTGLTATWHYDANTWGTKLQYQIRESDFSGQYVRFARLAEGESCTTATTAVSTDIADYCATSSNRKDTRHMWSFSASKDLNEKWYVEGELRQLDNSSTVDDLSFDNTTMTLTLGLQL